MEPFVHLLRDSDTERVDSATLTPEFPLSAPLRPLENIDALRLDSSFLDAFLYWPVLSTRPPPGSPYDWFRVLGCLDAFPFLSSRQLLVRQLASSFQIENLVVIGTVALTQGFQPQPGQDIL
jgi:hypothetical protein